MGGLAIGLGSLGQAAGQYGTQIRSILESRRHDLTGLLQKAIDTESDPQTRSGMQAIIPRLSSGEPIGKIIKDFSSLTQKRLKDEHALHEGIQGIQSVTGGQPAAPPKPPPGVTPIGQTPGTGGNALPPVAQPASNPIAGGSEIQPISGAPNVEPQAVFQPPPPVPEPQPVAVAPIAPVENAPLIQSPIDIQNRYLTDPRWNAPANRDLMSKAMGQELQHNEALRQEMDLRRMDLDERQKALREAQARPEWAALPGQMKAQFTLWAHSRSAPVPTMSAQMMTPHMISTGTLGSQAPPGTLEYGTDHPVVPGSRYRVLLQPATGESIWQPEADQTAITQTENGPQITNRLNGASIAPVEGGVYAPLLNPVNTGVSGGHNVYQSKRSLISDLPILGGGTPAALLPRTSVSEQPGAPPITTTVTRGGGAPIPAVTPPASHGGSIPPVGHGGGSAPPKPAGFNDPLAKANYETYINGGEKPTGREMTGVRLYAETHGLPMPGVLNSAGQKTIATLDPVMQQIDELLPRLNDVKGKTLALDYLKYKNGFKTPYDDIFTGIAFERLRSGSAALQGIGSRALPIFNEGLSHTPTFDRLGGFNPDSVKLMIDKLNQAKKIIKEERDAAVADQKKSGVLPSPSVAPIPGVAADPLGIR